MSTEQPIQGDEFEELYLKERKKSSMLLIAVIVLALSTVGSIIWAINSSSSSQQTSQFPGSGAPGQGFGGQGGFPSGSSGPGGGFDVTSLFNDDGSVDTDLVDEITGNFPGGGDSRFIELMTQQAEQAVEDGDITQDQADALIDELESGSSETSNET